MHCRIIKIKIRNLIRKNLTCNQIKKITRQMNTENTKAQMRKGILEFCILSLINNREMYVSDLIDELKKGKLDVVEGTLYPLLTRLKNGEFLAYRWEESTSGPPRKYYQITDKGKTFLTELLNTWNELTESVNQITKTS